MTNEFDVSLANRHNPELIAIKETTDLFAMLVIAMFSIDYAFIKPSSTYALRTIWMPDDRPAWNAVYVA